MMYQIVPKPDGTFVIRKFDEDLEIQSEWSMRVGKRGGIHCDCWQGSHGWCRHKEMFKLFESYNHIGDGWFFDYDEGGVWRRPVHEPEQT